MPCYGRAGRRGLANTLVLDNAWYHKCAVVQALAESLRIELLHLPDYSPNLNLIERLWRFLRKESLDSTYLLRGPHAIHHRHRLVPGRLTEIGPIAKVEHSGLEGVA